MLKMKARGHRTKITLEELMPLEISIFLIVSMKAGFDSDRRKYVSAPARYVRRCRKCRRVSSEVEFLSPLTITVSVVPSSWGLGREDETGKIAARRA